MVNYDQLITKKWYYFKYYIVDTDKVVEVKAENIKAADKIMKDNYADQLYIESNSMHRVYDSFNFHVLANFDDFETWETTSITDKMLCLEPVYDNLPDVPKAVIQYLFKKWCSELKAGDF